MPPGLTPGAVGSYPTISPLPATRALALATSAVCFLLPFPSPCGAQALPGGLPSGARTFLDPSLALGTATIAFYPGRKLVAGRKLWDERVATLLGTWFGPHGTLILG